MHVLSLAGTDADTTVERWAWSLAGLVRRIIARHQIHVVHLQYQAGAFQMHPAINLLPARVRERPFVTTFHDLRPPYLFPKAGRLRFAAMRRMARWSDAVVVSNPRDAQTLSEGRIDSRTIPLGPSLPAPDRAISAGDRVGYFGFPSRQKGFHLLMDALGRLDRAKRPALRIVGGYPPESDSHGFLTQREVRASAESLGVTVDWTGYLEPQAASDALAACRAIAFPFPAGTTQRSSALIAALQTGRPVVATLPREPGELGTLARLPQLTLVERDSAQAIRTAIEQTRASTMAPAALPDQYTWDAIARSHAALYRDLTGGRRT